MSELQDTPLINLETHKARHSQIYKEMGELNARYAALKAEQGRIGRELNEVIFNIQPGDVVRKTGRASYMTKGGVGDLFKVVEVSDYFWDNHERGPNDTCKIRAICQLQSGEWGTKIYNLPSGSWELVPESRAEHE